MSTVDRLYFSREEVAQALGLSKRSVDYLLSSGRLRSSKLGRRRVVHVEALKNFAGSDVVCKLA